MNTKYRRPAEVIAADKRVKLAKKRFAELRKAGGTEALAALDEISAASAEYRRLLASELVRIKHLPPPEDRPKQVKVTVTTVSR